MLQSIRVNSGRSRRPYGEARENLWRNGDFLKLWTGETVSQIGSQITVLALPLTAIITLGATPLQLGLLTAAQFAPIFIITPFAGVWLDTHRNRPILIAANLGRAALFVLVPLLFAVHMLTMGLLYAVAFLVGLLTASFDVAYVVYLPTLVTRGRLVEANAKLEATYSLSEVAGPGLGGVLVQAVTAPFALLTNAASYLLAALSVAWIKRPEPPSRRRSRPASIWADIGQGLVFVVRHPLLSPMALQSASFNLFHQAILTLYVLYGVRNLHLSPGLLGLVLATGSLGGLTGTTVAARAARTFGLGRTIVGSMLLASTALVLIPAAGGTRTTAISTLLAGLILYGMGLAVFNVHSLSLRAAIVPRELLGRVTASYRLISNGAIPLGGLLGGLLGALFGVRGAMVVAVVPLIVSSVLFAGTRIRTASERLVADAPRPASDMAAPNPERAGDDDHER